MGAHAYLLPGSDAQIALSSSSFSFTAPLPTSPPFPPSSFDGSVTSANLKEVYPFASHQWIDSLLFLPSLRQRIFLRHRFASSPITNPLGSMVFLGTPFYVKQWEKYGKPLLALTVVLSVALAAVVMLFYVFFWEWLVLTILNKYPT